ncbi:MAG: calcium/sodium antiporter [Tepidiformaceae bacterium]
MPDLVILALGIAAAGAGGELFVRGAIGLASSLRIPAGIIGATVAAFATSTPELSVAINAATAGSPELPLGDALGSNVANVALVLGIGLVLAPVAARRADLRRDLPFAFVGPALTVLVLLDGELGRTDGAILIAVFSTWLVLTVLEARRARSATPAVIGAGNGGVAVAFSAAGLVLLTIAGRLIVMASKGIGEDLGIDPFVMGATIVAAGTSTPELATTIISGIRGHAEIGLGTIVGSNIFNNLWIVGITALVEPIRIGNGEIAVPLVASALVLLLVIPNRQGLLPRARGGMLLGCYGLYIAATVLTS